ncbi:MAG: hypothetical protein RL414_505 [Actinomycetota bacterium]|jgi:hypothetical protein
MTKKSAFPELIDPRGPRFTAAITTVVLALALVTQSSILVLLQLIQFAIGGFLSPKKAPYGLIYINLVQPRLSKPFISEDIRGPQFAQKVGFLFLSLAFLGVLTSMNLLVTVSLSFALAAAFLNAVFNFCLGCEIYLIGQRLIKH